MHLLKKEWNPVFFGTFNVIISHIFLENFIEIFQAVQKIRRLSLSILAIFGDFHQFFVFFDIYLLAYNRRCQQFFTFNILQIDCLKIAQSYIDIRLVLLEIWTGKDGGGRGGGRPSWPSTSEKTTLNKPSIIRVKLSLSLVFHKWLADKSPARLYNWKNGQLFQCFLHVTTV